MRMTTTRTHMIVAVGVTMVAVAMRLMMAVGMLFEVCRLMLFSGRPSPEQLSSARHDEDRADQGDQAIADHLKI